MVCVDFDGTLLDFGGAIKNYLAKDGITFYPENVKYYDYSNSDIGCNRELLYKAFYTDEFYEYLKLYEGVIDAIELLKTVEDVHAYTGAVNMESVYNRRLNLIRKLGLKGKPYTAPPVEHYIALTEPCLKGGDTKPVIKEANAVFDDCVGVLYNWYMNGSDAKLYLIDAPYNQEESDTEGIIDWSKIIRCSSFSDAVNKYLAG